MCGHFCNGNVPAFLIHLSHQAWKHICLQAGQHGTYTSHQKMLLSASEPVPMKLIENFDIDFTGHKTGHLIKMNIFPICMAALYGTICPKTICDASSMQNTDGKLLQSPLKLYGKNIMCAQEWFFKPFLKSKFGYQGQSDIMMPEHVSRGSSLESFVASDQLYQLTVFTRTKATCLWHHSCPLSNTFTEGHHAGRWLV